MSRYATVYDWLQSKEVLDHALPAEVLEFFRTDEAASVPCKIKTDYTIIRRKGVRQFTVKLDVRGFSSDERASVDLNTTMTVELHNALCASASRAGTSREYAQRR